MLSVLKRQLLAFSRSGLLVALLIGNGVFLAILGLRTTGILQGLELSAYDMLLWSHSISTSIDNRIVMILANDEDQRQWGWPLGDKELVQLFEILLAQHPYSIGLDIYRDLPVPLEGGSHYERLNQLLKNHDNIFGIYKYRDERGVKVNPPPSLKEEGRAGFNDIPPDKGGVIRRGLLYVADEEGNVEEFFGLKQALHYLEQQQIYPEGDPDNPSAVKLGHSSIVPLDPDFGGYVNQDTGGLQFMLTYPGAPTYFQSFSITQILRQQPTTLEKLKGKILIIGVNAEATPDFLYTPFGLWLRGEQRLPGAIIHAYIISQILNMATGKLQPVQTWTEQQEIIWIWIWSLLSAFVCLWARSLWRFTLSTLSGLLILSFLGYLAFAENIWIPVAAPSLGWSITFLLMLAHLSNQDKQHRAILMQLFSKHVSKDVAEAIWKARDQYLSEGRLVSQRITATVLFTDLQGFTTVSENTEPQALMDWLNEYMELMVNTIEEDHNGQVNKFIGDAVMAVFGVPIPSITPEAISQDATNAVRCALAMREKMDLLCRQWQAKGKPTIRMRIGIFTGPLVVGSLGGIERQEYAVIGDTVNTASRLESYDKNVEIDSICRILVGQPTLEHALPEFQVNRVGEVLLKGKQSKVTIYSVAGRKDVE